jgi:hypothetical protein
MNCQTEMEPGLRSILTEPLGRLSSGEILAYFQSRSSTKYFPVTDADDARRDRIDDILTNRFEFNGERYELTRDRFWLHNPSQDREWLIILHKFYYATGLGMAYAETGDERYAAKWVELTSSWIETTPLDFLPSDVTGRRIRNWIYAHYYFVTTGRPAAVTPEFYQRFLASLEQQASYLRDHLSPHRNHRTLELCALFWTAAVFPEFRAAAEWLAFARQELMYNLETDLLADGVQCELSLDYHHIVLRNYVSVCRLARMNQIPLPAEMDARIQRALEFSVHAHTPTGELPAFSDGDRGDFRYLLRQGYELYGTPELLYAASEGLGGKPPVRRSAVFESSGYVTVRSGWGERAPFKDEHHLIFDCGPLGAGNHGHFDLLSFELAAYGRSLIVDPGRYTYHEGDAVNQRVLFRGTAAHNTILVDGLNQTRYEHYKGRHRVRGPEPDRELRAFQSREEFDFIHALARSHEYPAVHERRIWFMRSQYWVICDHLRAEEPHDYDLLFHLSHEAHGKVTPTREGSTLRIDSPGLSLAQAISPGVALAIDEGFVSPRYGIKLNAPVLRFSKRAADTCFVTVLYPYRESATPFSVDPLPDGIRVVFAAGRDQIVFPIEGGCRFERHDLSGKAILRYAA